MHASFLVPGTTIYSHQIIVVFPRVSSSNRSGSVHFSELFHFAATQQSLLGNKLFLDREKFIH